MKRHVTSLAELAAIFQKSVVTFQRYGHEGCACQVKDKDDRGRYSVAAIRRWLKANHHLGKQPSNPSGRGVQTHVGDDRARLRRAQAIEREAKAKLVQLELKAREGELVAVEAVKEHAVKVHRFMRESLLSWARSCGPKLAGKDALTIQQEARKLVEELMRGFSGEDA